MASANLSVSLTETPQFRRLIAFVVEVKVHADATSDEELAAMVEQLHRDLLEEATD